MRAAQLTFDDHRRRSGRGGPRRGAGRPRGPRPIVHHVRREGIPRECPVHVTLRVRRELGSLRTRSFARAFRASLREACERSDFRVAEFSIQRDHVHLIAEASSAHALGRGMKSISARLARLVNRLRNRRGPVLLGRYHVRALRTPREVRNALAYVLLNARKHFAQRFGFAPPVKVDEASSGPWFSGWTRSVHLLSSREPPPVAPPRSWMLRLGWRRHGLIDPAEVPGARIDARLRSTVGAERE
jgi:REP element-mobilizing transposase RayT